MPIYEFPAESYERYIKRIEREKEDNKRDALLQYKKKKLTRPCPHCGIDLKVSDSLSQLLCHNTTCRYFSATLYAIMGRPDGSTCWFKWDLNKKDFVEFPEFFEEKEQCHKEVKCQ